MRNRIAVLAIATAGIVLVAVPALAADHPTEVTVPPFGHGLLCARLHTVTEVRQLAKKAWSQPHGPTKVQTHNYRRYLACPLPGTRGRMKAAWHRAQHRYRRARFMARLKARCGTSNVAPCVEYAAIHYGQDTGKALEVARAESGLRACPPENPTHHGTFQFDDATWSETPYHNHDVCDPYYDSMGAMWFWARGEYSRWVTY